ncbi:hypothetical protein BS47DRAFT_1385616 [Hydnum rufescens UP504]|uniref:Uncharacterized protein n=1 Tax=Hydnum rufescens UP504 TaxID=1448309 RepID=A0A9P6AIV2_9AGAM|nr:hypothetical protein BS47DRAFT_1385616 [Hydnum rufescens UP504]
MFLGLTRADFVPDRGEVEVDPEGMESLGGGDCDGSPGLGVFQNHLDSMRQHGLERERELEDDMSDIQVWNALRAAQTQDKICLGLILMPLIRPKAIQCVESFCWCGSVKIAAGNFARENLAPGPTVWDGGGGRGKETRVSPKGSAGRNSEANETQ